MSATEEPSKETLLKWVKHLTKMNYSWYNGNTPGTDFRKIALEIEEYLSAKLLDGTNMEAEDT